jgi:AcrR family transcriptional regulator
VSEADVLNAALELFSRRGYRGTTLAAIAEAIGVTDAAVLRYFDSKAAILEAVLAMDDEESLRRFRKEMSPGGLEALRLFAETGAEMESRPVTTRMQIVLAAEALSEGSELHGKFVERYHYVRHQVIRALERGINSGEIRADVDPVYEATALQSFIEGLRINWFYFEGELPFDDYMRKYVGDMVDRIAAPPRTKRRPIKK